jgi:spore germination protein PC
MHVFIQSQKHRIDQLERTIKNLTNDVKELKGRPPISVGTIEYKFDQLKVETLDGTLNIGLNPSDLEGIEDFEVNKKDFLPTGSPKTRMETTMDLEDSIHQYLDTELTPLIKKYEQQLGIEVDHSYIDFIKEDLRKQLPSRIDHLLRLMPIREKDSSAGTKLQEQIEQQMIKDINQAVLAFISNLPNNRKDD